MTLNQNDRPEEPQRINLHTAPNNLESTPVTYSECPTCNEKIPSTVNHTHDSNLEDSLLELYREYKYSPQTLLLSKIQEFILSQYISKEEVLRALGGHEVLDKLAPEQLYVNERNEQRQEIKKELGL